MKKKVEGVSNTSETQDVAKTLQDISIVNRQQEMFEFLKNNLSIDVDVSERGAYYEEKGYVEVKLDLTLKNPVTGLFEKISSSSGSFNV